MYVQKNDRECSLYRVNGELIMELYEVVMAGGSGTRVPAIKPYGKTEAVHKCKW